MDMTKGNRGKDPEKEDPKKKGEKDAQK